MNNKKQPQKNITFSQRIKIFFKKFSKLDLITKLQFFAIVAIIITIIFAIFSFVFNPNNENEESTIDSTQTSMPEIEADKEYEIDAYTQALLEYEDTIIKTNTEASSTYNRDILFIGDSNTEALATYEHVSLQQVIGVTGMGIQSVPSLDCVWFVGHENPYTIPEAVKMMQPRTIIINYGTNNIGGMSVEEFIAEYLDALNSIENAYSYSNIIVNSIFPVAQDRDYPNITMQEIDEFNIALAKMCSENGYMFLNSSEVLRDSETGFMLPEYASSDGLHLSKEGLKKYIEYVGSHKYEVEDTRPAVSSVPTRRNPPVEATPTPTLSPTPTPTLSPTPTPTLSPTPSPTLSPSPEISPTPSIEPSVAPSVAPSAEPSVAPSVAPSAEPSEEPPAQPSEEPPAEPSAEPAEDPTPTPSISPSPETGTGD